QVGVKLARVSEGAVTCTGTMVLHEKGLFRKLFPADFATADFAYSLKLISKGKRIMYVPRVMGRGIGPTSVLEYAAQQARWLDNIRDLLSFSNELGEIESFRKQMHVWAHGVSHLHHLAAGMILLLGISTFMLDLTIGGYLLTLYLGYLLYRLLRGKIHGTLLRMIDVPTLMKMDVVCAPILFKELITIIMRKESRYKRTPKV
ncbi:MAG: glycosyltransferase family 2 protein, partial [Nitrososphaerales archaeon]